MWIYILHFRLSQQSSLKMLASNLDVLTKIVNVKEIESEERDFSRDTKLNLFQEAHSGVIRNNGDNKNTCKNCDKQLTMSGHLKTSIRIMHDGIKYACDKCKHQETSKGDLTQHKRAAHRGKSYPCELCDYQATAMRSLNEHKRTVHEEINYPCEKCPHQASRKIELAMHRRATHEGIKQTWEGGP